MKIHFLGICGTAMGNAALLLRKTGHTITGSDTAAYPPMGDVLRDAGVEILDGYDPARLAALAPDIVVAGNALSRGNPEIEWLLDTRALPLVSLPALLHDLVLKNRRNIVVAGTHGKTTTTAIAAHLLSQNALNPGWLIGGSPVTPADGNAPGDPNAPFVIEGDEYDAAFFDKRSKFIHYAPSIAVLNNIEFDHADIFRDLPDVQRAFAHLTRIVPRNGWLLVNGDDPAIAALPPVTWTRVLRAGVSPGNDIRLADFSETPGGSRFTLLSNGKPWAEINWRLPGLHNARNAMMAAAAAQLALLPTDSSPAGALDPERRRPRLDLAPLATFQGVRRRHQTLASNAALTVIEDFAHHPTAIAETLRSLRARHPGARLTAVFEPRSNTARTRVLQNAFRDALALADEIAIAPVNRPDKLPPAERFDTPAVLAALAALGRATHTAPDNPALLQRLLATQLPRQPA
ncbi:MAG: Mur ligase domain-containing protein, partial [Opitutaceae bacterium]|nr:Mur ligase domain-containing protein [Opitutaceae bacterium]